MFARELRRAAVALVTLTLVCGVVYPLVVTAIGKVAFARQAAGGVSVHLIG